MVRRQRQSNLCVVRAENRTEDLARIHILPEIRGLTFNPARERQTDLRSIKIRLCKRQCGFCRSQGRLRPSHLGLLQRQRRGIGLSCKLLARYVGICERLLKINFRGSDARQALVDGCAIVGVFNRQQHFARFKLTALDKCGRDAADFAADLSHELGSHCGANLAISDYCRASRCPDGRRHLDTDRSGGLYARCRLGFCDVQ